MAVGAPDAAVEAQARRARDEAVRREHAAIEGYRREHSDAALTRRWASTKCTPGYITHQMNAQRARLRPAYYSLATAGGANKIRSSTWVL